MTSDEALCQTFLDELEWNPNVTAIAIGVSARSRIVELTGHVASYAEKRAAEKCVQKIVDVEGLEQEINVRLPNHIHSADDRALSVPPAFLPGTRWSRPTLSR